LTGQLRFGDLGAGFDVGENPGQALPADVDAAVDDGLIGGKWVWLRLRMRRLIPLGSCQRTQRFRYVA
jgi:hypothetical protein